MRRTISDEPVQVSQREWRQVIAVSLLLIGLSFIPYLAGWTAQTPAARFSGAVIGADDFHSYIGKMRLGARGVLDFELFYTPEPHEPVSLVFLSYILPGRLVGLLFGESDPRLTPALIAVFHSMRALFSLLMLVVVYRFIAQFIRPRRTRMTALLLAAVGGGFGWLFVLMGGEWLGSLPPDVIVPEGFSFLILLSLPHLALARSALLSGFILLMRAETAPRHALWALGAGICWLLVGLIVPFYLAVIYALLGTWGLALWIRRRVFPWRFAVDALIAAGVTAPLFLYLSAAFSQNPVFAAWSAQNLLPSPHPLHYLIAYSVFIVFGTVAVRWAWRRARCQRGFALLLAWPLAAPVLVYLPLTVQRRMAEAVIVPLAILAAHGLAVQLRRMRPRRARLVRRAVLALASLTSLVLLLLTTLGAATSDQPPIRLIEDELAALAWLAEQAPAEARVLVSMPTGNIVPAYTDLRPYVGHGPETLGATAKEAAVQRFFAGAMTAEERRALYESVDIQYVYYGRNERDLSAEAVGQNWADGLNLIYEAGGVSIYQVGG